MQRTRYTYTCTNTCTSDLVVLEIVRGASSEYLLPPSPHCVDCPWFPSTFPRFSNETPPTAFSKSHRHLTARDFSSETYEWYLPFDIRILYRVVWGGMGIAGQMSHSIFSYAMHFFVTVLCTNII